MGSVEPKPLMGSVALQSAGCLIYWSGDKAMVALRIFISGL